MADFLKASKTILVADDQLHQCPRGITFPQAEFMARTLDQATGAGDNLRSRGENA